MSLFHRIVVPAFTVIGLGFLIACGSSSNNNTPPPSGGFSNTNFNGTYTFSIAGTDTNQNTGNLSAYSVAGTVTACGCANGQLTAGTVDLADTTGATGPLPISASGSGYKVNANGIGTMTLNIPQSGTSPIQVEFVFVLTDAAHGLISEFDQFATGSGTIDLQPNPVTAATTPYTFSVSGSDGGGNPLAVVGDFTLDSSGVITTGIADFNDGGTNVATAQALSGSLTVGTGTSAGTATLSLASVTLHFDVYAVDATHLKLIATDSGTEVLVGDVFSQGTAAIPAGSLAFTMAGSNTNAANIFSIGGIVTSDGSSTLTNGAEDINLNGQVDGNTSPATPYNFTGTFLANPSGTGRFQVALSNFQGGANFAAYPSTAGVILLEVEPSGSLNPGTTSGMAILQNSPAGVVASQGYAMNLTGADIADGTELDQIAQFNTTSSNLSGAIYQNDFGFLLNNYGLGNSSNVTPGATGEVVLNFNGGSEGAFYYGVDGATSLALGVDNSDISLGAFEQQGSPSSTADVAPRHLAMIKAAVRARAARKKRQQ